MDDDLELDLETDSLDAIPAAYRALYAEDNGHYRLRVRGAPDVTGLRSALEKYKKRTKEFEQQTRGLDIDGEPLTGVRLKALVSELEELRQQKDMLGKNKDEQVTSAIERVRREVAPQIEQLTQRLNAAEQKAQEAQIRLRRHRIESALEEAAMKMNIRPEFFEDVKMRADKFTVLEDADDPKQAVVMVGADGEPAIGTKQNQKYISPGDFLETMIREKPGWQRESAGGGAQPNMGRPQSSRSRIMADDKAAFSANIEDIAKGKIEARLDI